MQVGPLRFYLQVSEFRIEFLYGISALRQELMVQFS
jgi:hypothetical protein